MVPRENGKGGKQERKVGKTIRAVLSSEILKSQVKGNLFSALDFLRDSQPFMWISQ